MKNFFVVLTLILTSQAVSSLCWGLELNPKVWKNELKHIRCVKKSTELIGELALWANFHSRSEQMLKQIESFSGGGEDQEGKALPPQLQKPMQDFFENVSKYTDDLPKSPRMETIGDLKNVLNDLVRVANLKKESIKQNSMSRSVSCFGEFESLPTQFNMALTFQLSEKYPEALKEYSQIITKYPIDKVLFNCYFNMAITHSMLKDIPNALESYQKALDIDPDNKMVKTNIELLLQQQNQSGGGGDGAQNQDQQKGQNNQDQDKKKQDKEGQNNESQKKDNKNQKPENEQPEKKKFNSKELTKDDVRRILDEIKDQEQKIRAGEMDKAPKENPRDRNW